MFTALVQDQADFVQLFLDNGVNLKTFLNVRRLQKLYEEVREMLIMVILKLPGTHVNCLLGL